MMFTKRGRAGSPIRQTKPAARHEAIIFEGDILVVRERVSVRLILWNSHVFLERELTQADGTSFVHSLPIEQELELYEYITADPYCQQLQGHYNVIQKKYRELLAQRIAE